jgi:transglutaminase-like putative cysteine protease
LETEDLLVQLNATKPSELLLAQDQKQATQAMPADLRDSQDRDFDVGDTPGGVLFHMLIHLGYDIIFDTPLPLPFVTLLKVHVSRVKDLRLLDELRIHSATNFECYVDSFGNTCCRFFAPAGQIRLSNSTLIYDTGEPDPVAPWAREIPVQHLPTEVLQYLLSSRYCEVDRMSNTAAELFGGIAPGWNRVQAVCTWVHENVTFGYPFANPQKTAFDVFRDRCGVCRDFQHLAVTMCRALNIPARYATGYLGDIGVPASAVPMDFSAWFEVYLEGRWWTFDARHNQPRIGRVLMAVGRDASDVALTTSFGMANLLQFRVTTEEVPEGEAYTPERLKNFAFGPQACYSDSSLDLGAMRFSG